MIPELYYVNGFQLDKVNILIIIFIISRNKVKLVKF